MATSHVDHELSNSAHLEEFELSDTLVGNDSERWILSGQVPEAESQWGLEIFRLMREVEDLCRPSEKIEQYHSAENGVGAWADSEVCELSHDFDPETEIQVERELDQLMKDIEDLPLDLSQPLKPLKKKLDPAVEKSWARLVKETEEFDQIYRQLDLNRRGLEGTLTHQDEKVEGRAEWDEIKSFRELNARL
jgi:hypothetical protein